VDHEPSNQTGLKDLGSTEIGIPLSVNKIACEADLLIAYLPLPSMGTAMEMWQAYQHNTYIIAITPYVHHWAIRFTSNDILPDLQSLFGWMENGRFLQEIVPAALALRQS
jgi:hypothetical protein